MGLAVKPSWVGEKIAEGRYKILAQLGEGGMGKVFRAYDARLETEVVLKCPRPEMLDDAFRTRFEREIRSLVRLSHPHVVTILDIGDHESVPFVVMQFLGGGSLKSRIYPGISPQPQTLRSLRKWLPQISGALDFVHKQRYVHRDVKPANILFDEHGNAYLSDFGLTCVLTEEQERPEKHQLTQAGFLVGTAHYVAPEIVLGHEMDGRADQYSLAVTVFEAVTAKVPFSGPTTAAIVVKHAHEKPPRLHEIDAAIPKALSEILDQALAKDPRRRFANCTEFAEAVLEHCSSSRTAKPSISAGTSSRTTGPRIVSRGENGNIACPKCERMLALRPEFAGRRAVCQYCRSRLLISQDLCELTLIPEQSTGEVSSRASQPLRGDTLPGGLASQASVPSGVGPNPLTPQQGHSSDSLVVLEERVFGLRLTHRQAVGLAIGLVLLALVAVVCVTRYMSTPEKSGVPEIRSTD